MANSEWTATEGPVRYICSECGSDDVYGSATVTYDDTAQSWGVLGEPHAMHCRACDRSNVEVNAVQINRPLSSSVPVFMRAKRFANEEGAL